jgi:hypothetical protein
LTHLQRKDLGQRSEVAVAVEKCDVVPDSASGDEELRDFSPPAR